MQDHNKDDEDDDDVEPAEPLGVMGPVSGLSGSLQDVSADDAVFNDDPITKQLAEAIKASMDSQDYTRVSLLYQELFSSAASLVAALKRHPDLDMESIVSMYAMLLHMPKVVQDKTLDAVMKLCIKPRRMISVV